MKRVECAARPDWEATVESQGFHFHTLDDDPYWDETAHYEFTSPQIDELKKATYALNDMCLAAVQRVIDDDLFQRLDIPAEFRTLVNESWQRYEFTLYGRFDLAYDGASPPTHPA